MQTPPRIEFSAFRTDRDPMLAAWQRFRGRLSQQATPGTDAASLANIVEADEWGVWRLLASNNREVARSAWAYHSFGAARSHVLRLREHADRLEVSLVDGPLVDSRGWTIGLDGTIAMTCARWYPSTASCTAAAENARNLLAVALVTDSARHWNAPNRLGRRFTVRWSAT
ncbi:hypothetical protein ACDF64_06845 [Agromyces sp. MMS24-JH15]|uniref:hypothetical protein n=1 Tax=Agromyces sp. MMS24-JH15 TaxID=3243765 RepID=UPI00374A0C48